MEELIHGYKRDRESVYNTWFISSDNRLKAFRSIRKSLLKVIREIEDGLFGNDFKGSSLETVISAISEQKQLFEGAAHAFFWKPKLRIPDIYENDINKRVFGRFLKACLEETKEDQIVSEIKKLDEKKIKGLGPAVANILYFLHPTLFPPCNTAIVNGFNLLYNQKMKLGSWSDYLEMREFILAENNRSRGLLSNDLGAIAGLLFEVGNNRIIIDKNAANFLEIQTDKEMKARKKRHKEVELDELEENAHTEMQYYLAKIGRSLGYKVWIARNDHKRVWNEKPIGEFSINNLVLPAIPPAVYDTVSLIDVLWLDDNNNIVSGFEVEKSTSIYSGILRLNDLALSIDYGIDHLLLVAPEHREKEIRAQLLRPAFRTASSLPIAYILFRDLRCDCEAMCKFGHDVSVLSKISKVL